MRLSRAHGTSPHYDYHLNLDLYRCLFHDLMKHFHGFGLLQRPFSGNIALGLNLIVKQSAWTCICIETDISCDIPLLFRISVVKVGQSLESYKVD